MAREEMKKRIEEIRKIRFGLAMIDRWDYEVRRRDTELMNEEVRLMNMMKGE